MQIYCINLKLKYDQIIASYNVLTEKVGYHCIIPFVCVCGFFLCVCVCVNGVVYLI